jgi:hypothetical protein
MKMMQNSSTTLIHFNGKRITPGAVLVQMGGWLSGTLFLRITSINIKQL